MICKRITGLILVLSSVVLGACAAPNMLHSDLGQAVSEPEANKALVVFMGSRKAYTAHAAVFEDDKFVAMVPHSSKFAYMTNPGKHLYMVVSEAADFLDAELLAGKTYYVIVAPRMGGWRARFSLLPVHREGFNDRNVQACIKDCQFVINKASGPVWAELNQPSILSKKAKYYDIWLKKSESDRPILRQEDGM